MKALLLSLILFITTQSLVAQGYLDFEKRGTPITSIEQLQGDWRCVAAERMIAMEYVPSNMPFNNYRTKGDSTWYFEYPCKYYGMAVSNTDSIVKTHHAFDNLRFLHDTLVIFSRDVEIGGYRMYVRDTFDDKIVDALIRDTLYLPSLFGKWYLQTQDCMDYSGEPPWRVTYPVYMPLIYKLDKTDIVNKNTVLLNVNGTLRKFKIIKCSIKEGYIELESDGWYKENFEVVYFNRFKTVDGCGNAVIYR